MNKVIIAVLMMFVIPCSAVEISVEPDGSGDQPTIQAAINVAAIGDEVVLSVGTYTGNGNRDIDLNGKAITVRSVDPKDPAVVASTIIDCQGSESEPHRGFHFHNNEDANSVLDGFTITGGYGSFGGAILCQNSSPLISNCEFVNNFASAAGGAIENENGSNPILTNCVFRNNSSDWVAGALRNHTSSPLLINCLFIDNSTGIAGGAIQNENSSSNPILMNCTFAGNTADGWAAGIVNNDSIPVISNCIFWGNSASGGTDESAQIRGGSPVINYSCIQGWTGGFGGVGNIGDDPLFASGPLGDYYLSQVVAGQAIDSPCVDTGSDQASVLGMNIHTTCTDEVFDSGIVDMGYHYPAWLPVEIDIAPETLNLASNGKWITCYIWLPGDYDVADVNIDSILLEGEIAAEQVWVDEGEQVVMVKFGRADVQRIVEAGEVELIVSGELIDGARFEGTDAIKVIDKGEKKN